MAIDLTSKAKDIAGEAVKQADNLLDALEAMVKLLQIATASGINMTTYDDDLAASGGARHVDGATFNKLSTAIPAIEAAIDAADGASAGVTIRQLLNQLRQNF